MIEGINLELMKKLGLIMSKEMEGELTWLTLIILWI
jgi:hypothetical protein